MKMDPNLLPPIRRFNGSGGAYRLQYAAVNVAPTEGSKKLMPIYCSPRAGFQIQQVYRYHDLTERWR